METAAMAALTISRGWTAAGLDWLIKHGADRAVPSDRAPDRRLNKRHGNVTAWESCLRGRQDLMLAVTMLMAETRCGGGVAVPVLQQAAG